ncbi:hypothetical protein, partial [Caballeronia sp. M23-90]
MSFMRVMVRVERGVCRRMIAWSSASILLLQSACVDAAIAPLPPLPASFPLTLPTDQFAEDTSAD